MHLSLDALIQEYEFDCIGRGHSANTLNAYRNALKQFRLYSEAQGVTELTGITPLLVRGFAAASMKALSPGGAHTRLRVLRALLRWATDEGYFERSPMERVPMPRLPKKVLDAVTPQDMRKLLLAAQASQNPMKLQALLALLYDTGLRISELCGLELLDLLPSQRLLVREGKGARDRVVPVSRHTLKLLNRYIEKERSDTALPNLFLVDEAAPYDRQSAYKLLERLCKRAGVKRYGPHCFRRGFAVNFLRNGGDVFTLQRILGHSSLEMTRRYAAMTTDDLQDVHRRASPMSALR